MENVTKTGALTTLSLLATLGLTGCASDSGKANGAGGAESTGGAANTGGTIGQGGAHTGGNPGTSGAGTSGESRIGQDCSASDTSAAPADGLIADFADPNGGYEVADGRILVFPRESAATPATTTTNGNLHIAVDTPATSDAQYVGIVLGFESCIDATNFTGVQFTISGSFAGCALQYGAGDLAHQDKTTGAPFATGPEGSYQPLTTISADQLESTPETMQMPFSAQSGGNPGAPIDRSELILILWQFNVAAAAGSAEQRCTADITIDDVAFYN